LEPGAVIARLSQDNRQVPTINAYEELLPKRTEHHRLQALFLVTAMDERVRVLEALQRRIQSLF